MLAILALFCALAQQKTVCRHRLQPGLQRAPARHIGLKGTNQTTLTDAKGQFSILVSGNESVLKFTYAGMAYQETTVGERTNLTITLAEDKKQLEDVVVVDMVRKRRSTSRCGSHCAHERDTGSAGKQHVGCFAWS